MEMEKRPNQLENTWLNEKGQTKPSWFYKANMDFHVAYTV